MLHRPVRLVRSIVAATLPLCLGCAFAGDRPPRGSVPSEPVRRVDARAGAVEGQLMYRRPLKGLVSREHYVIEAIFTAVEASLTVHSHFNDFTHRDGIVIRLKRAADRSLTLMIAAPGQAPREAPLPPNFVTNEGRIKFRLEVHNGTTGGARVLLWRFGQSLQGEVESARPYVAAGNADFDSAAHHWFWFTHGRGVHFGVEFDHARVGTVTREAPYVD